LQLYYVIIEVMNNQQPFISYHIRLQGKIDLGLASWLPELFLVEETDGKALLSGELPDQAALLGVLLRIHNLNYQILSVEIKNSTVAETHHGNVQNA